jgi:hypothetical protein
VRARVLATPQPAFAVEEALQGAPGHARRHQADPRPSGARRTAEPLEPLSLRPSA